tara:strand:- start:2229 stop:3077 length:849 start_codon:yes stop_codon:yes gene_type:complete
MIKLTKYFFQAIIIYLFFIIIKIIGLKLSRIFFSKIFMTLGPFVRKKKIIQNNLSLAGIKLQNINHIEKEMWSNYGMTFVEYIFLNDFRRSNSHIDVQGLEILDELKKKNKSAIFISGHFANFELMSMELTKYGLELATIYRPLNNYFLNPFMEYLRRKHICKNQIKKGISGIKEVLKYLENNCSIAMMVDQRLSEGEKIDLFGKPAATTTLPAQLSIRFNLDIIPIRLIRNKENTFSMKIDKPIEFKTKNKIEITKSINKVLEKMVLENPSQWIWTHNRWR